MPKRKKSFNPAFNPLEIFIYRKLYILNRMVAWPRRWRSPCWFKNWNILKTIQDSKSVLMEHL